MTIDPGMALAQLIDLKDVKRAGWARAGLQGAESVADHSFSAALLAMVIAPGLIGVDRDKLVRLLLVHDLAESDPSVGDITPFSGVPAEEKLRRESEAIDRLCGHLPGGDEVRKLWNEYADSVTPEACLAHEFDALEMGLQARAYQARHGVDLSEFVASAKAKVRHPGLCIWLDEPAPAVAEPVAGE